MTDQKTWTAPRVGDGVRLASGGLGGLNFHMLVENGALNFSMTPSVIAVDVVSVETKSYSSGPRQAFGVRLPSGYELDVFQGDIVEVVRRFNA